MPNKKLSFGEIVDGILDGDPEILKKLDKLKNYIETIKSLKKLDVLDVFLENLHPKPKEFFKKLSNYI